MIHSDQMKAMSLLFTLGCAPSTPRIAQETLQGGTEGEDGTTETSGSSDTAGVEADDAQVVAWNPPNELGCGETAVVELVMRNTGTATWTRDGAYKLGAVSDSDPFIGNDPRVWLPEEAVVPPGSEWTFEIEMAGPETAGTYTSDWQMVHEYVSWFGESVATDISVACEQDSDAWESEGCARNGSEICDDEVFGIEANVQYGLRCEQVGGGISYVSRNTGPVMSDGMERCQGWEENGQNAWDHLDYIVKTICENEGDVFEVDLSAYAGGYLWFGSHDHPDGGGDMTNTCLVKRDE